MKNKSLSKKHLAWIFLPGFCSTALKASPFPLLPRNTIQGIATTSSTIVDVESMIPILGDPENKIAYVDFSGAYDSREAYLLSPGVGFRLANNNQLFGAYVFADFTRTLIGGKFVVFNPGIEWMAPQWDMHINGYFPNKHSKENSNFGLASLNGNNDFISFRGHQTFDQDLLQFEIVGNGVDAELGYLFPIYDRRTRLFAGGYHFASSHGASSISGVVAGLEFSINQHTAIIVEGSHDNIFNTKAAISLRVTIGSIIDNITPDVRTRFVDPIPRHLATLRTAAGVPSQNIIKNSGINVLKPGRDIWFFEEGVSTLPGVTIEQCTIENPCVGINQNVINSINSLDNDAIFYFAPGNYYPIALPNPTPGILQLDNGQTFWGRNFGYLTPASGTNRAVMNGVMQVSGNNTLDSLQIINDSVNDVLSDGFGPTRTGVHVLTGVDSNILNNLNIQITNNDINSGAISIFAEGNSPITISNSTLNAIDNALTSVNGAENIAIVGTNKVTVSNTDLRATIFSDEPAYNIYNQTSAADIHVTNSTFNATSFGSGAAGNVFLNAPSSATITGSSFTVTASDTSNLISTSLRMPPSTTVNISGAENIILDQNSSSVLNNCTLTAINQSTANSSIATNLNNFFGTTTINNSKMSATDNSGDFAANVYLTQGNVTINNNIMNATQVGANPVSNAFNVLAFGGPTPNITITNSTGTVTSNSSSDETAALFLLQATGNFTNNTFNVLQQGNGSAAGINATESSATISNSQFTVNGTSASIINGIFAIDNSVVTTNNNTTFQLTNVNQPVIGATTDLTSSISTVNTNWNILTQFAQAAGINNDGVMTITNNNFVINGDNTSVFNSGANAPTIVGGSCVVNGNPC